MKKTDLRIGNHVLVSGQPFQIPDGNWIDLCAEEVCKGIPLTKELLEQMNIKYSDNIDDIKGWELKHGCWLSRYDETTWYIGCVVEDQSKWLSLSRVSNSFQYLHQLQNIFYSLFNVELI